MTLFRKDVSARSDEELMQLLTKGGQSAFDELYKRYSKPLFHFFFRLLNKDREKAEDFLQDLFLKIIEQPERFDVTKKFSSWIYTLASNMIKNEYRSSSTKSEHEQHLAYQLQFQTHNNGENIDQQLFDVKLTTELNKLDMEDRMLFYLRFDKELNIKQIAEIIKCPEGTVKSRLFYLTKQLSNKLRIYKLETTN